MTSPDMSGYLLDTNVISELVRQRPDPAVISWLRAQPLNQLFASVVTFGELRKGIEMLPPGAKRERLESWLSVELRELFANRILTLDLAVADRWGTLEAHRALAGKAAASADAQIAATAAFFGLTVATRNGRDFQDLDVPIVDPWSA